MSHVSLVQTIKVTGVARVGLGTYVVQAVHRDEEKCKVASKKQPGNFLNGVQPKRHEAYNKKSSVRYIPFNGPSENYPIWARHVPRDYALWFA